MDDVVGVVESVGSEVTAVLGGHVLLGVARVGLRLNHVILIIFVHIIYYLYTYILTLCHPPPVHSAPSSGPTPLGTRFHLEGVLCRYSGSADSAGNGRWLDSGRGEQFRRRE